MAKSTIVVIFRFDTLPGIGLGVFEEVHGPETVFIGTEHSWPEEINVG